MTECNGKPHFSLVTIGGKEFCPYCEKPSTKNRYDDKAEATREFYRKQGADRERERIIDLLKHLRGIAKDKKLSTSVSINALIPLIGNEMSDNK
jgi:uncharacterized Zn finger protein (UPF0148 family)